MVQLGCHFQWSDGRESQSIDQLLTHAADDPGQTACHLAAGHLQEALEDQGYAVLVKGLENISKDETRLDVFLERLAIYHAMHRRWLMACDFTGYVGRIDKLFRKGRASLLPGVPKKLAKSLAELADAVCSVAQQDDEDEQPREATARYAKAVRDSAELG